MHARVYVQLNIKLDLASVDQLVIWSTGGVLYTCVIILMTYERSRDRTRCYGIELTELVGTERIPEGCGNNPNYILHCVSYTL